MKKALIIVLAIIALVIIYIVVRKVTPDRLGISVETLANGEKRYTITRNGKFWYSERAIHRTDLIGEYAKISSSDGKNEIRIQHLATGIIITGYSSGKGQFVEHIIID